MGLESSYSMRLTHLADYAVVMMTAAARRTGEARLSATELSDETGVPLPTAQKLMQRLAAAGLLVGQRGAGGGYALARPVTEISLADFYTQGWNAHIVGFISPHPEETKGEDLTILARLVADGRLTPRIGLVLDWERTPDVFEQMAAREFRGKAVLTLGG